MISTVGRSRAKASQRTRRGRPPTAHAEFHVRVAGCSRTVDGDPTQRTDGWLPPLTGPIDDSNCVDLHARRPARVRGISWESAGDRHIASLPGDAPRRRELNSSGALLVELADGRHSVREIATYLKNAHSLDDDPVHEILDFYEDASSAGLVTIG